MMSNEKGLQEENIRVGTKQTIRMIELGQASEVYVAEDADPRVTSKVIDLCREREVKITFVDTMKNLGKACGIDVGAATVAIVHE